MGAALWAASEQELNDLAEGAKVGEVATLSDGATTAEAYRIAARLVAAADLKDGEPVRESPAIAGAASVAQAGAGIESWCEANYVKLVNTGTIDAYELHWCSRPTRYLGRSILQPVIAATDLAAISGRRLEQACSVKVVVAGLAGAIEAAVAPSGWLCGKSAVAVIPRDGVCAYALCAVLNSSRANAAYRVLFGHRGFSSRSLAIGPRQLERLGVPRAEFLRPAPASLELRTLGFESGGAGAQGTTELPTNAHIERLLQTAPVLSLLGRTATEAAMKTRESADRVELDRVRSLIDRCVESAYAMSRHSGHDMGS